LIGLVRLEVQDVLGRFRALVVPQFAEGEESMRHPTRGEDHDASVGRRDRLSEQLAQEQEVLGLTALVDRDARPALTLAQVAPDVDRPVEHRQVRVVARQDPRVVATLRELLQRVRQLRVARHVVRDLAHAARQLVAGELPFAPLGRRDDVLERRLPVGVEDHDGVGLEPV